MKKNRFTFFIFLFLLARCSPGVTPDAFASQMKALIDTNTIAAATQLFDLRGIPTEAKMKKNLEP